MEGKADPWEEHHSSGHQRKAGGFTEFGVELFFAFPFSFLFPFLAGRRSSLVTEPDALPNW